jgi:radical SAM enzyme (TIGR01210 family)
MDGIQAGIGSASGCQPDGTPMSSRSSTSASSILEDARRQPVPVGRISERIQAILKQYRSKSLLVDDGPTHYAMASSNTRESSGERGIIGIPTRGCSYARSDWKGCSVCGHNTSALWIADITPNAIWHDFIKSLNAVRLFQPSTVCLYSSGSFFDYSELPEGTRLQILTEVSRCSWIQSVIVESLPTFLTPEALATATGILRGKQLIIGMGLDSANYATRCICFQRHISNERYLAAIELCKSFSVKSVAYIVHGAPFLSISNSVYDTACSVRDCLEVFGFDSVSIEPIALQPGTIQQLLTDLNQQHWPDIWSLTSTLLRYAHTSRMPLGAWTKRTVIGGQVFTPLPKRTVLACARCLELLSDKLPSEIIDVLSTLPLGAPGPCCAHPSLIEAAPLTDDELLDVVLTTLGRLEQVLEQCAVRSE